jgi:uncharacterized protein YndB with AHSA1/START domain
MARFALVLVGCLAAGPVLAEVADSAANGFTIKIATAIQAPPEDVYRKLIQIGGWWDSAHTFSSNSHNLTLDDKPLGCFCEKLGNGGGVRHMQVVFVSPGQTLVMTGGLGPLQSMAVTANLRIQLSKTAGGTKVDVTYAVGGYSPAGLNALAAPVDSVLTQQFARLKNFVERGDPGARPVNNP